MLYFVKSGKVRAAVNGQTPHAAAKQFIKQEQRNENLTRLTAVGNNLSDDTLAGVLFDTLQLMESLKEDPPKLRLVSGD
jgi:hypothetical protein